MSASITAKYAVRSLFRHTRRTLLSVAGIGLGCAVCLLMVSFVRGEGEMMMRAAAESGTGHLRAVPGDFVRTGEKSLRLLGWEVLVRRRRTESSFRAVAPRARVDGLLAFGTRSVGVEMAGVDPAEEPKLNRLVRRVVEGRYLRAGDTGAVVVGQAIARRLRVEVDDDLMVTVSGFDGEMRSGMLRIVGLVSTGSRELDAALCQTTLEEVEKLTGFEGASEIAMLLNDPHRLAETAAALRQELPAGAALQTWAEVFPEMESGVQVDETWTGLMVGLVVIVVFLGVASAQLAAVLERRKEFAVLAALGMRGARLVRIMILEGVVLGGAGGLLALLLGLPLSYLMATRGIDFSRMYGEADLSMSNILIDPVLYGDFGWWLVPLALGLSLSATILSALYPAWYAQATDPASALRVEQ
ncbi:MAG: FtsX-like permease family protein [Planctomycetota bacterium]